MGCFWLNCSFLWGDWVSRTLFFPAFHQFSNWVYFHLLTLYRMLPSTFSWPSATATCLNLLIYFGIIITLLSIFLSLDLFYCWIFSFGWRSLPLCVTASTSCSRSRSGKCLNLAWISKSGYTLLITISWTFFFLSLSCLACSLRKRGLWMIYSSCQPECSSQSFHF